MEDHQHRHGKDPCVDVNRVGGAREIRLARMKATGIRLNEFQMSFLFIFFFSSMPHWLTEYNKKQQQRECNK